MISVQSLQLKKVMKMGVLLGLTLLVSTANAQAEESATSASVPPELKVFEVAPVKRLVAVLAPNAQTPAAPSALDATSKARLLEQLGDKSGTVAESDSKTPGDLAPEQIVLSAQQPFVAGQAMLTLIRPERAHPETGIQFDESTAGSAAIKLMVQKGHTYLLDFAVRSLGAGSYVVETAGGSQKFDDTHGDRMHILLALNAAGSGWTTVRLKHAGSGYYLYSAEVTTVK